LGTVGYELLHAGRGSAEMVFEELDQSIVRHASILRDPGSSEERNAWFALRGAVSL